LLIPIPEAPNTPANITILTRVFAALFYVIPLAIGLWWLIFFTRKGVVAQFKALGSPDAELDPTTSPSAQLTPAGVDLLSLPVSRGMFGFCALLTAHYAPYAKTVYRDATGSWLFASSF
jgi:hypothetical protein